MKRKVKSLYNRMQRLQMDISSYKEELQKISIETEMRSAVIETRTVSSHLKECLDHIELPLLDLELAKNYTETL